MARFSNPQGIAADEVGFLYVADRGNRTVRKISPDGVVSTLAGDPNGPVAQRNGTGSEALFLPLYDIAVKSNGDVFVTELTNSHNQTIRKITAEGTASMFDRICCGLTRDGDDSLYASSSLGHNIIKYPIAGPVVFLAGRKEPPRYADGTGSNARFNAPSGMAVGVQGELYVADSGNHLIRKVTQDGVVTTVAGMPGVSGNADGDGAFALFNNPRALAVDSTGNIYVADRGNASIRLITPSGSVSTITVEPALVGPVNGLVLNDDNTLLVTVGQAVVRLLLE